MKILTREQLEKLPTKRLLAYKSRLLRVSDGNCSCGCEGCDHEINQLLEDGVLIKSSPIWQQTYAAVKEILSTREHVERQ
jgi:hypothetical protein